MKLEAIEFNVVSLIRIIFSIIIISNGYPLIGGMFLLQEIDITFKKRVNHD